MNIDTTYRWHLKADRVSGHFYSIRSLYHALYSWQQHYTNSGDKCNVTVVFETRRRKKWIKKWSETFTLYASLNFYAVMFSIAIRSVPNRTYGYNQRVIVREPYVVTVRQPVLRIIRNNAMSYYDNSHTNVIRLLEIVLIQHTSYVVETAGQVHIFSFPSDYYVENIVEWVLWELNNNRHLYGNIYDIMSALLVAVFDESSDGLVYTEIEAVVRCYVEDNKIAHLFLVLSFVDDYIAVDRSIESYGRYLVRQQSRLDRVRNVLRKRFEVRNREGEMSEGDVVYNSLIEL